ncbi:HutD family protein [Enterobacillus tribolii]|uniref:HutD protein n=1 Tax=Enterobacillus tribolii TaxID=1487935 RepID=A0A370QS89_9GAMM|nr:HutD family protein [Enterobacillus tribolii]MBW7983764.1 HutD family protein [Enterobacillus tribolii]RDK92129.1 hypothetical protein C8D90_104287 [Enterobacillus tribolii]
MSQWQIKRQDTYSVEPGVPGVENVYEILRTESPTSRNLRWRLARVDIAMPFVFPTRGGCQHILSALEGRIALTIDEREAAPLAPWEIGRFSGDSRVACHPADGPVRGLSLCYDPRHYGARLQWSTIRPDAPPVRCHASTIILFCALGEVTLIPLGSQEALTLHAGDSAVLVTPNPQTHSVTLLGGGHVGVFELTAFQ